MKNAYVIGHITVKNPEAWAEYRNRVPDTLTQWNAEVILRGKLSSILAGEHAHMDTVVILFPNLQAVHDWYASSAYQALIPLRQQAAEMTLLTYEQ